MKNCRATSRNRIFKFVEQGRKLTLNNINEVESTKIRVDDCEITEGIRCDYMHVIPDREFYIELKGQDIKHAVDQIKRTIGILGEKDKILKRTSYIICTRCPLASTEVQFLQREFRKKLSSELIVRSSPHEDSY
jgi:hypothetical protein